MMYLVAYLVPINWINCIVIYMVTGSFVTNTLAVNKDSCLNVNTYTSAHHVFGRVFLKILKILILITHLDMLNKHVLTGQARILS